MGPKMNPKRLSDKQVLVLMGRGYALIRTHTPQGVVYAIPPHGVVDNLIAEKMIDHELVGGQRDGFWPGLDQTYRMMTD
jgi:hypothetical protein